MNIEGHATHQSFWLWVMCLTGVDYFSTLGYQPSIAYDATGLLAPFATLILVGVTLGCALPIYSYVAGESFAGQGSIAMLERLLSGWRSKFLVLVLLGFAATDFVITKTLSAADAAEHLIHNPLWQKLPSAVAHSQLVLTAMLLVVLGGVFLRGFREAIGLAVALVAVYLSLNILVIGSGLGYLAAHPHCLGDWLGQIRDGDWHMGEQPFFAAKGWLGVLAVCVLYFPKLALGLSGFETGVAVMPLVRGDATDDPTRPTGRIRNTRKLLITAAIIMSFLLSGSALVTATLIRPHELMEGGAAANRALAFLAHGQSVHPINPWFGELFGTLYDLSTVSILWFAGASAMSGLLNLVPRYLPRYGMAPEWASAVRPLVLLFTVINLLVTWFFGASVEAQSGAYATGVMVLISSACVAVGIDQWNKRRGFWWARVPWKIVLITLVFFYTTVAIVVEKPEGITIASIFITTVIGVSLLSRTMRSTELRLIRFEFVDDHSRFLWDTLKHLEFPVLVPHRAGRRSIVEKEEEIRAIHRLTADIPIVYIEATLGDTSEFYHSPQMEIVEQEGRFIVRVRGCVSIAHVLAAIALELSKAGEPPELHFGWSEESPLAANVRFVLFGEGNVPWLVRELIRLAEPDPARRPRVVIG
ncbi:MAG: amino acid transporter [Pirellulaceae bacterium]